MKLVSEIDIMEGYGRKVKVQLTVTVEEGEKGVDRDFVELVAHKLLCELRRRMWPGYLFGLLVYNLKVAAGEEGEEWILTIR